MTMTNRYDPSKPEHRAPCQRTACAEKPQHPGGLHLDQRSEFYDGPDTLLAATSMYVRDSARKIIRTAPELTPEVVDLVTYLEFMRDQVAHAHVDRDRGIRQASARALECEAHGEVITGLEGQVAAFDASAAKSEAGRLALLGFLHAVDQLLESPRADLTVAQLLAGLKDASKKTHAAHTRAWSR